MSNLLDKKKITALKKESVSLDPLVNVGKSGVTDAVIEEIKKQLKDKKLVKVRILRSADAAEDLKGTGKQLAQACGAELIDVRGRTISLYRA